WYLPVSLCHTIAAAMMRAAKMEANDAGMQTSPSVLRLFPLVTTAGREYPDCVNAWTYPVCEADVASVLSVLQHPEDVEVLSLGSHSAARESLGYLQIHRRPHHAASASSSAGLAMPARWRM